MIFWFDDCKSGCDAFGLFNLSEHLCSGLGIAFVNMDGAHDVLRLSSRETNWRSSSGDTNHRFPCLTYRIFLERVSFRISHTETESICAAARKSMSSGLAIAAADKVLLTM